VTLEVEDNGGATDSTTKTVEVGGEDPSAEFSISPSDPLPDEKSHLTPLNQLLRLVVLKIMSGVTRSVPVTVTSTFPEKVSLIHLKKMANTK